ncbi:MAG: hypothetical protein WCP29_04120 [Acidobacteriota bacterium]
MSKAIKYTNDPIGAVRVVRDFLPPPEELAFREEAVKVTISLSKRSVAFFKAEARRHDTQYQKMIRQLIDRYAERYARSSGVTTTRPPRRRPAA